MGIISKKLNPKKRLSVSKKARAWLGVVLFVALGITAINDFSGMIQSGRFGINFSFVFSLFSAILLFASGEHTETIIIGSTLYAFYDLVNAVIKLVRFHVAISSFFPTIFIPILFAGFIIFVLYRPLKPVVIKLVSGAYCVYMVASFLSSVLHADHPVRFIDVALSFIAMLVWFIIPLIFVFAKYEDAEENALGKIVPSISATLTGTLSGVHMLLSAIAVVYLEGHAYGSPDKYGDYKRGLTKSEVAMLDRIIPSMWIVLAVLTIIFFIHRVSKKLNTDTTKNVIIDRLMKAFMIVCVIGSVWVSFYYSMYE